MPASRRFEMPPLEAPRAPSQEEWESMDPAQQQAVVDALVCSESQEELDQADAMAESDEHYEAKEEVRGTLRTYFERMGREVYVGAERKVLYPGHKGFTPDIIVVVDVSPHKRDCWMVGREGRGIDVIIEVFYKGNWRTDFADNVASYAALGVPEYFIYDVKRQALTAYRLPAGTREYAPIRRLQGRYGSEKLGLDLGIRRGRLRFYRGTAVLPTPRELIAELEEIAEQEQARAEQEQARAEQEQARAEQEQARAEHAEQELARAEQFLTQLQETVLSLLNSRGLLVNEVQAAEVRGCADSLRLRRWFDRALIAQQTAEVFLDS